MGKSVFNAAFTRNINQQRNEVMLLGQIFWLTAGLMHNLMFNCFKGVYKISGFCY